MIEKQNNLVTPSKNKIVFSLLLPPKVEVIFLGVAIVVDQISLGVAKKWELIKKYVLTMLRVTLHTRLKARDREFEDLSLVETVQVHFILEGEGQRAQRNYHR